MVVCVCVCMCVCVCAVLLHIFLFVNYFLVSYLYFFLENEHFKFVSVFCLVLPHIPCHFIRISWVVTHVHVWCDSCQDCFARMSIVRSFALFFQPQGAFYQKWKFSCPVDWDQWRSGQKTKQNKKKTHLHQMCGNCPHTKNCTDTWIRPWSPQRKNQWKPETFSEAKGWLADRPLKLHNKIVENVRKIEKSLQFPQKGSSKGVAPLTEGSFKLALIPENHNVSPLDVDRAATRLQASQYNSPWLGKGAYLAPLRACSTEFWTIFFRIMWGVHPSCTDCGVRVILRALGQRESGCIWAMFWCAAHGCDRSQHGGQLSDSRTFHDGAGFIADLQSSVPRHFLSEGGSVLPRYVVTQMNNEGFICRWVALLIPCATSGCDADSIPPDS